MADGWRDAVRDTPGGVLLKVEVAAGAREARFPDGYNPWRERLGLRVRAPAQKGAANREATALVAAVLGVPAARVAVTAGHLDARKELVVTGLSAPAVLAALAPFLEAP